MEIKDEKTYLKELIEELKEFLTSDDERKIELTQNLSKEFLVEEGLEFSDRTKEISTNLETLKYYEEDTEGYYYLAKTLLEEAEEQLSILSPEEEREQEQIEEQDEAEKELEDEEDSDYEEKFVVG